MIREDGILVVAFDVDAMTLHLNNQRELQDLVTAMAAQALWDLRRTERCLLFPTLRWLDDKPAEGIDGKTWRIVARTVLKPAPQS